MGKRHSRPRTTYEMVERLKTLANDIDDSDGEIRRFHEALTVVVESLEDE